MSLKNISRTKKKVINEQRAKEDWTEIEEFLYESHAARVKAREIIEEYLEGQGKEQRTER